ncbi:SOH1-domain-containing protein [Thamnocephalis sphaerospora]|uniref:Mediator of RNA polymerase II transcription subunit 31 n=1 Tax=Thamnocephalis sphaerospora TaxID=78915 RepID=A0A4V1IX78_9FUNG|nr:SOH1-domain-containing protein [Thamnocephalis sphaerospora]|eukprot:RKP10109.1 SOH1-domain-containing protein [Thamnocephalis sphaerospora]
MHTEGESVATPATQTGAGEDPSRERFELELEFVQSLANPFYLHYLAQQDYFDDPCFVAYLEYLAYWRKPEYAKFVVYPHCLHYLGLLQHAEFRQSMRLLDTARALHGTQYKHWRFWREGA